MKVGFQLIPPRPKILQPERRIARLVICRSPFGPGPKPRNEGCARRGAGSIGRVWGLLSSNAIWKKQNKRFVKFYDKRLYKVECK